MAVAAQKLVRTGARLTQAQLQRLVRFPSVRKAISSALARATPERAELPGERGRYVRFRLEDPRRFHPSLFATISVGKRGTKLVIGTPKAAIRKPKLLAAFLKRMGRALKDPFARKDAVYQLRDAGIIGGSRTQSVLVPLERVRAAAARFLRSPEALRRVGTNATWLSPVAREIDRLMGERKTIVRQLESRKMTPRVFQSVMRELERINREIKRLREEGILWNPLTRREAKVLERDRRSALRSARWFRKYGPEAQSRYYLGVADEAFTTLKRFGPKKGARENPILATLGFNPDGRCRSCKRRGAHANSCPKRNPLTRREAAEELRHARYEIASAKKARDAEHPRHAAWLAGRASGRASVVHARLRAGRSAADRIMDRAETLRNPGAGESRAIRIPFRDGQRVSPARIRQWLGSLPPGAIRDRIGRRFEQAMAQYRKFHLGSEPNSILYKTVPLGSASGITDVDAVVSEGKEWMAPYQVPAHSGKFKPDTQGRYIHAHGESELDVDLKRVAPRSKLPERFHTADGKFVGVIPSKNVRISDWYRG